MGVVGGDGDRLCEQSHGRQVRKWDKSHFTCARKRAMRFGMAKISDLTEFQLLAFSRALAETTALEPQERLEDVIDRLRRIAKEKQPVPL